MVADANKSIAEGDPEVSEAVDLARYYARVALGLDGITGARPSPIGPVVVSPPWNFPLAIPAGGVLAALAAGNSVILKPAPQSRSTGALIAELCWAAGIDRDVLQLVPADDDEAGRRLITHPDIAAVILTGSYSTAQMFLGWRPDLRLHAETSGKNSIVITACADIDGAVMDLVRAAFGHAGQKCSAASLAIVEAPLYDSPAFLERVRDAAASLRIGPAGDVATEIGPLIDPPGEALQRALTTLDLGERWCFGPRLAPRTRRSGAPASASDVGPGSWFRAHRVLRPRARDNSRRRPRPHDLDPERQRLRAHCRAAVARSRRDRSMDRTGGSRQPLRQPRHHWRHRAPPTLWRVEALCRRPDCQGGWPEITSTRSLGGRTPASMSTRSRLRTSDG